MPAQHMSEASAIASQVQMMPAQSMQSQKQDRAFTKDDSAPLQNVASLQDQNMVNTPNQCMMTKAEKKRAKRHAYKERKRAAKLEEDTANQASLEQAIWREKGKIGKLNDVSDTISEISAISDKSNEDITGAGQGLRKGCQDVSRLDQTLSAAANVSKSSLIAESESYQQRKHHSKNQNMSDEIDLDMSMKQP